MSRLGSILGKLPRQWALGVAVLLVLALFALAFGLAAWVALFVVALLAAPNISEAAFADWFLISALIWLPLAAGLAFPLLKQELGRHAKEEAERPSSIYG